MTQNYINALESEFERNANVTIALEQKAYMRNQFDYYGIKAPQRRLVQKPFLVKQYLPPKQDLAKIVKNLWKKPQRDFQHFAQELACKYVRQYHTSDIGLLEHMVTHKSWWDTVDYISVKLIGPYFKMYPERRDHQIKVWMDSENIWLQRSCLLFQLKYKQDLDKEFLSSVILPLLGSKEFFINKAIGWVLREYSKTNSAWVTQYVNKTALAGLSKREALRLIK